MRKFSEEILSNDKETNHSKALNLLGAYPVNEFWRRTMEIIQTVNVGRVIVL